MKKLSETSKTLQIRISLTEQQLEILDCMAGQDNRAAFIRRLIRQEWDRRQKEAAQAGETNGQRL